MENSRGLAHSPSTDTVQGVVTNFVAFLAAVGEMPEASGVALGFDRLVMLASGALRIDQVVWTPPAGER